MVQARAEAAAADALGRLGAAEARGGSALADRARADSEAAERVAAEALDRVEAAEARAAAAEEVLGGVLFFGGC